MYVENTVSLTHTAVLMMLQAAVARADEMGQPQCQPQPACILLGSSLFWVFL